MRTHSVCGVAVPLCSKRSLSFFGPHQECLEVGVENQRHWKRFCNDFELFLFSPYRRVRGTPLSVRAARNHQVYELQAAALS